MYSLTIPRIAVPADGHRDPVRQLKTVRRPPIYPNGAQAISPAAPSPPFRCPHAVHRWIRAKEAIRSHVRMYLLIATKNMRPGADEAHELLLTVRREIRAIEDERRNVWRQECDDALAEAADLRNELIAARARIGTLERSATNREKRRAAKLEAEMRE